MSSFARLLAHTLVGTLAMASLASCTPPAVRATATVRWYAGRTLPAFDPDGPPDALRVALERHLSRGLVERDSGGVVAPGIADSIGCSADSLLWTFRLTAGLRFTDGSPVTSDHVRDALLGGLAREDHATRAWLLSAVRGVSQVRAGRALPSLGIEALDPRRLQLRLAMPDHRLLEKLAVPGVSTPWKKRTGEWTSAVGVGPYRVLAGIDERSFELVATDPVAGVEPALDSLRVTFGSGSPRGRTVLRRDLADVIWPLPPGLLEQTLPEDWSVTRHRVEPARRLLLVLRADMPPLTRAGARQSLAHALNREELLSALGTRGTPIRRWLPGTSRDFDWPRLETPLERAERLAAEASGKPERRATESRSPAGLRAGEARSLADRGARRESWHLVLAYDADLAAAQVAPVLQGQWEKAGHYVDLRALRGRAAMAEPLRAAAAPAQLVECQAPFEGAEAELAQLVMPLRGPAVGGVRTGWRTRDFDRWLTATGATSGLEPDAAQAVLEADRIVLPIAGLPWQLAIRRGVVQPVVHPAFGPDWTVPGSRRRSARTR